MRLLQRSGVCALALLAGAAAFQFEPAVLTNLDFGQGERKVAVGAVRVPLWSAAFAQAPDTFSLENVSFTFGPATYEASRVDFSGVTSSRADIEGVFSSAPTDALADRLARISARQIVIPELRVKQKFGNETQTIIHRNVALKDVAQGRIASLTSDTTGAEISDPKGRTVFSYGRTSVSDLDMQGFARLYETRAGASNPLTKIHGAFSMDNIDLVDTEGTAVRIARLSGRDFMARATKDSWAGTIALFGELSDKGELAPKDEARILSAAADFLGAIDVGLIEATGIEVKASPKSKGADPTARIGRLAYSAGTGSQPADARAEGLEFTKPDGRVKIRTISFTGFSFASTLDALKTLTPETLKDPDPATLRSLVPTIGTMHVSGLDIDVPDETSKSKVPERVRATLKDFEFTADQPFNAVPSNIRIGFRNLAISLPPNSKEEGISDLLALGYRNLDLSFLISANWNGQTEEISVRELSFQGQDMGGISLTGQLGNVSKDLFNPDTALASVALVSARAKSLNVTVENKGLFERFLNKTAKEEKTTPDALRQTYGTATAVALPAMIGNSEQAKTLSRAIARFVAKPGRLTINARTKDADGLGVADLMMLAEPSAILEKLTISATAE